VGLADAWRSEEEQAALEVLAVREKSLPPRRHIDHMMFDGSQ